MSRMFKWLVSFFLYICLATGEEGQRDRKVHVKEHQMKVGDSSWVDPPSSAAEPERPQRGDADSSWAEPKKRGRKSRQEPPSDLVLQDGFNVDADASKASFLSDDDDVDNDASKEVVDLSDSAVEVDYDGDVQPQSKARATTTLMRKEPEAIGALVDEEKVEKPKKSQKPRKDEAMCVNEEDSCHFTGRFRPRRAHHTSQNLVYRSPKFEQAMQAAGWQWQWPQAAGSFDPLPNVVSCMLAVDDTLDAIYYNGARIPGIPGVGVLCNPTPITFSFAPVAGANLTIIAHDQHPGTGLSSCAGIGISCTANNTAYYQTANWMNWLVRGQTSALFNAPGAWSIVGPGTSSSLSCGMTASMPIRLWQSGSTYVAAQWITPAGTTTTTTTTPNITFVNVTEYIKNDATRLGQHLAASIALLMFCLGN